MPKLTLPNPSSGDPARRKRDVPLAELLDYSDKSRRPCFEIEGRESLQSEHLL